VLQERVHGAGPRASLTVQHLIESVYAFT